MTEPIATAEPAEAEAGAAAAGVQAHLDRGDPLLAYDLAQGALARWPGHVRLRQLQGLALARAGDVARAHGVFSALEAEGHGDAETLGMLARTAKDLGLREPAGAARTAHFTRAFGLYERAYEGARRGHVAADTIYAGVNAATMAVLLGRADRAREIATQVHAIAEGSDPGAGAAAYWREATLGETALVLGEREAARTHYERAATLACGRYGDLGSTRRQARFLAEHLGLDADEVTAALSPPPVLVYTGHMIDRPDRASPRFPPSLEPAVREALRERIGAMRPAAAYGSAACGADLLCLELVREAGGETHVVLPFPVADFRRESVAFAGGDWARRLDAALAAATTVTVASDHFASGSTATYEYANLLVTGMGKLRAQALGSRLEAIAVLDPGVAGAAGGAGSADAHWRSLGIVAHGIDLARIRGVVGTEVPDAPPPPAPAAGLRHEMRSLLFADAVGYSRLTEDQIPRYVERFLGAVAQLNRRTANRFEHVETAGDGLYLVFPNAPDAARYALELNELASARDWVSMGLPAEFDLRIALHAGPVYCGRDPVTEGALFTGPHTSRAARIEPITPPGQVYASAAFAAVAAASGADDLRLRYVGRLPLAKGAGQLALYHVERA
jgi:tetratricopeptide (TPR) repeat protein